MQPKGKEKKEIHGQNEELVLNMLAELSTTSITISQNSDLFGTSVQNMSCHIINILNDKELDENSVIKDYLITASDGKKYNVIYYSLEMILAIGYRVRSIRGVQFRQWATRHLSEYLVKGFTMDDDRLKNPDGRQRPQASRRSPCGSVD